MMITILKKLTISIMRTSTFKENCPFFMIIVIFILVTALTGCVNKDTNKESYRTGYKKILRIKLNRKLMNYYEPIDELLYGKETSKTTLLIDKSDLTLSLMINNTVVKQYPVVIGRNSVDDKLQRGDLCTPEGKFKIKAKYNHVRWSRFIWIDYPNEESLEKIAKAKKTGQIPVDSKPGGEIGLHGVPSGTDFCIDLGLNLTLGCIAMKNRDVKEIYEYVQPAMTVIIKP